MRTLNVRDYGAKGDGETDDSGAICNALYRLPPSGGVLYFPAGVYRQTSCSRLRNLEVPINIRGDGANVSILKADDCDGLDLHFNQDERNQQPFGLTMRDIGLRAHGNAGTALSVSYGSPEVTNDHARSSVSIRDVVIESCATGSWANGVMLEGCWNPTIENTFISGNSHGGDGHWNKMTGSGVELRGYCVNAHLSNVRMNFWAEGLKVHSNTEGLFCNNCSLVGTKRGVWIKGDPEKWPGRFSTLTWTGGLIECRVGGVTTGSAAFHIEDATTVLISGAQMLTETLQGGSTTYGVIAQNSRYITVASCAIDAFNMGLLSTGPCHDLRSVGNTFCNTQTERQSWGE